MRYKVETITPDRARKLLDRTEQLGRTNRSIRRNRVEKLAHAITLGQWQVTHQPIAIAVDGSVIDGQHRLHAIVAADQAIDLLIVRDVDPATFGVVDTGAARTTGDSLKIAGYGDVNVLSGAVRAFLVYERLIGTTSGFREITSILTTADVLEFLDDSDRRDVALGAVQIGRRTATQLARYGLNTAIAATLMTVRLHPNELGPTTVAEFYARLGDGVSLAADSPILALRRWFTSDTGYARVSNRERRVSAMANTIKALNDHALGKSRAVVAFRIGTEPYPAPLPSGSFKAWEDEVAEREARELVPAGARRGKAATASS